MKMHPLGDSAVIIEFDTNISLFVYRKVNALAAHLQMNPFPGMIEYVPAFTTVTVYFNPIKLSYKEVCLILEQLLSELNDALEITPNTVEIPVCYGDEFGPDLQFVAKHNGLTEEDVIHIHSDAEYLVYMIGFAPGFPYLGGMSERIAAPRRSTPRLSIHAGTVGIAGMQTGIYPLETPGGWQLIGRTPIPLFQPGKRSPSLLQAGDIVRFKPISSEEYEQLKGNGS